MLLRFIYLIILSCGLTSCIGLKPRSDNTRIYAFGINDLAHVSSDIPVIKGYIARPQFPVYMEGVKLKLISSDGEIVNVPNVRWAEPVDMGVARAISFYIESLNNGLKSDFYPWVHTDDVAFTLQLNFHHLIATDDGRILISVSWKCDFDDGGETKTGFFTNDTLKWSDDVQNMVSGMDAALKLLATEIVDTLKKEALIGK